MLFKLCLWLCKSFLTVYFCKWAGHFALNFLISFYWRCDRELAAFSPPAGLQRLHSCLKSSVYYFWLAGSRFSASGELKGQAGLRANCFRLLYPLALWVTEVNSFYAGWNNFFLFWDCRFEVMFGFPWKFLALDSLSLWNCCWVMIKLEIIINPSLLMCFTWEILTGSEGPEEKKKRFREMGIVTS